MGLTYYCDVHRTRKNGEGFRITFTSDGVEFRHADGFEEIRRRRATRSSWTPCRYSILTARWDS